MFFRVLLVAVGVVALSACPAAKEDCANGKDDDGNGKVDCNDPACSSSPSCGGPAGEGEGSVGEGEGSGGEGEGSVGEGEGSVGEGEGSAGEGEGEGSAGEGEGEGAAGEGEGEGAAGEGEGEGAAGEGEGEGGSDCNDGVDNDGDGFVDSADPACINGLSNEADDDQCNDGVDNDFDGLVDDADPQCAQGHEADATSLPNITVEPRRDLVFTQADGTTPTTDGNPITSTVTVGPVDSELLEGCYTGTGARRRIEFNAIIRNTGARDLVVGASQDHQPLWNANNPLQEFLFEGWLKFEVTDATGAVVAQGHKGSFCMLDLVPPNDNPTAQGKFNDCNANQGISVGFGDEYSIGLPCEFVDVTGVPTGDYSLHIEADFTHQLPESDYTDNFVDIPFHLN